MKVLISPGYGSGWSTWNDPMMAFDRRLIKAFERGISKEDMKALCVECGYVDSYGYAPYMGGFDQLKVIDVPSGVRFQITEYDGSEKLKFFNEDDWYYSRGKYYI